MRLMVGTVFGVLMFVAWVYLSVPKLCPCGRSTIWLTCVPCPNAAPVVMVVR